MKKKTKMTKKEIALQIEKAVLAIRNRIAEIRKENGVNYKIPYEEKEQLINDCADRKGISPDSIVKIFGGVRLEKL